MSSLPKWLQKIKDQAEGVPKGPWHVEKTPKFRHPYDLTYQGGYYILHSARDKHIASSLGLDDEQEKRNFDFIVGACNSVPKLIELVEEMARALEGTEIPLRLASDALYKTDKHDLFRETAQAQFQVRAMLRKYRGEDEDG